MTSGELDRRATFLRRPEQPSDAGNERGGYAPLVTVWAGYSPMSATRREEYGYAEDVLSAWLKIRESSQIESLTIADRVRIGAQLPGGDTRNEYAVDSVPLPDRSGYRLLRISRKM